MPDQVSDAHVPVHQMVYGSAAKLLAPGTSDLGVIASTKDFPQEVARSLATHRAFPTAGAPQGKPDDSSRYIAGIHGRYVELTRIQQGVDHTGRIVPFANHLLVERDRLQGSGVMVGEALERASAICQDPRLIGSGVIDPSPSLPVLGSERAVSLPNDILVGIADIVLRYATEKRTVVLVAPARGSDDLLPIVSAVANLLPASDIGSLVAATHVIDSSDRPADASIVGTYAGTPVHADAVGRSDTKRPLVIDMTTGKANVPVALSSPFARATFDDLRSGRPGDFARRCERLGAKQTQHQVVADMVAAETRLLKQPSLSSLESFRKAIPGAASGLDATRLQEWANGVAIHAFQQHASLIIGDAISQAEADGAARLAAAIGFSRSLLAKFAQRGCQSHQRQLPEAAFIAEGLRSLGPEGIEIARRVANDPKVNHPSFLELLADTPAPAAQRPAIGAEIKRKELPAPKQRLPAADAVVAGGVRIPCDVPLPTQFGESAAVRPRDRSSANMPPPRWLPWITWAARLFACAAIIIKLVFLIPPSGRTKEPNSPDNQAAVAAVADSKNESASPGFTLQGILKSIKGTLPRVTVPLQRAWRAVVNSPRALLWPAVLFVVIWGLTASRTVVSLLSPFVGLHRANLIPAATAFGLSVLSVLLAAALR